MIFKMSETYTVELTRDEALALAEILRRVEGKNMRAWKIDESEQNAMVELFNELPRTEP